QVGGHDVHPFGQAAGEGVDDRRAAGVEEAVDEDDYRRRVRRPVETGRGDADTVDGAQRQQLLPPPAGGEGVLAGPVRDYAEGAVASFSLRHSSSILPSSVLGGAPLRYSASRARQLPRACMRPHRALSPHTTRSRITYDGGMLSWRMTSPYSPWMSIIFSMVLPTNSRESSTYSC